MISKAVITAAGLGTRLLPTTKEIPKEMLPLYMRSGGRVVLKPVLQGIFEVLYSYGVRDFCFVVGRGKRSIEDHFTPDWRYVELLIKRGKENYAEELSRFYEMLESSRIFWVNQAEPRGFGHAVLMAKSFVDRDPFFVAAGDTYIYSRRSFLEEMAKIFRSKHLSAVLLLKAVEDPRAYGVAVLRDNGVITGVVEKPENPPSRLAIMPYYIFDPLVMRILENLGPGYGGEIQLTDAIQRLVEIGRVGAVTLGDEDQILDVGDPEKYWEALATSYRISIKSVEREELGKA